MRVSNKCKSTLYSSYFSFGRIHIYSLNKALADHDDVRHILDRIRKRWGKDQKAEYRLGSRGKKKGIRKASMIER
ncbi:hypothetical protein TELCIR_17397 [Teladorsagia circumcincta]|uniref:Uncharacterized protein n=1 Tax=Teladorsagia circumcincta TaxID=45464 RepID=A0A2G9TSW0_TELCI|nr:hypothetical protein TELCIR_17397 [Teladorsagia circumcincta]